MSSPVEISIPTTSTSATAKPYTIYNITLRQPLRSYTVQKRYSDFQSLHVAITAQCSNVPPPVSVPGKSWFKSTISSPELTEERRKGLETYLQTINTVDDASWRRCDAWRQFLNLPNSSTGPAGQAAASATRNADLTQATIVDPTVWLDVHRELKSQIADARQALRKRIEASTAQVQHEASAEAKKYMVRSGTTISALEAGLQRLIEQSKAPKRVKDEKDEDVSGPSLGDGEIRRRRDLLSAAKKERDGLETQLTAFVTKNTTDSSGGAVATDEQKTGLFQRPSGTSSQGAGRRVLGGPMKETDKTRELDNEGVLQLQKQIMQEQEQDVGDLTHTVRRLKEMGVQINNELVYQNEMLGLLDQDVERVGDKIKVAKKRVEKIN